jgi:hypothetical protein
MDASVVSWLCDAHARLWQRLHEWFDEPPCDAETDPGEVAFRAALEGAQHAWEGAWTRWRVARRSSP